MIVSCPSCSTGYKLDESRITGRGVRITCPKCKHVFVVYKEAPAQPMPKAQASASLVEAVEDERPADPDGPTSFFHTGAGGLRPADLTASTRPASPASPALPPPRPPQPAPHRHLAAAAVRVGGRAQCYGGGSRRAGEAAALCTGERARAYAREGARAARRGVPFAKRACCRGAEI
jgi:predicted Zn finger-like uncharacterized protein